MLVSNFNCIPCRAWESNTVGGGMQKSWYANCQSTYKEEETTRVISKATFVYFHGSSAFLCAVFRTHLWTMESTLFHHFIFIYFGFPAATSIVQLREWNGSAAATFLSASRPPADHAGAHMNRARDHLLKPARAQKSCIQTYHQMSPWCNN